MPSKNCHAIFGEIQNFLGKFWYVLKHAQGSEQCFR